MSSSEPARPDPVFRLVQGERRGASAAERAATYLREQIFDGALRPGNRVDQNAVAAHLDLSRQPVREAVLELATDGLLVVRPQHGVFVGAFDADTVRGHFELYGTLRSFAAAKVAATGDPLTLERLRDLVGMMERSDDPDDIDAWAAEFFRTINIAAGNVRLRFVLRSMSRFVPGNFYARYPEAISHSRRGARRILRAIERRLPAEASEACLVLWREGGEAVIDDLVDRGVLEPPAGVRRRPRPASR